jgi:predicted metallopeptidase
MGIKYELAEDIMARLVDIAKALDMGHVKFSGVYAVKSRGSGARGTIARCHALSKIWQKCLSINAVYIIEVITEKFDRMSREEQDKVLIHELMHIPKSFGGGFIYHNVVNDHNVEKLYKVYKNNISGNTSWFKL